MDSSATTLKARYLFQVLWFVAHVSAPFPFMGSSIWEERRFEPPLMAAPRLLATLSAGPQIHLTENAPESSRPTLLSLLRPESPATPSLARDLIATWPSFDDVSLHQPFIGRRKEDGQAKDHTIIEPHSPSWAPDLIPSAAFFEDVSLASRLIRKKSKDGPPNDFAIPEPNSPPWEPISISNAASLDDASIVPPLIGSKGKAHHVNLSKSNQDPTSSTPPQPLDTPGSTAYTSSPNYADSLSVSPAKKPRLDPFEASTSSSSPPPSTPTHTAPPDTKVSMPGAINRQGTIQEQYRPGAPFSIDKSMLSHMGGSNSGGDLQELTQLPGAVTHLNTPLDITSAESLELKVKTRPPASLYLNLQRSASGFLSETGRLSISIFAKHVTMFNHSVHLKELLAPARTRAVPMSPSISLAMKRRSKNSPVCVIRITRRSDGYFQTPPHLTKLYRHLLKWIYMVHEDLLKKLEIPTYVHYTQNKRLLQWLHVEIFTSLDGAPLMGIKRTGLPRWEEKDNLGPAKVILLNYLREHAIDDRLAFSTAWELIEKFQEDCPRIYSAPKRALDATMRAPTSPDFEQRMKIVSQLASRNKSKIDQLFHNNRQNLDDDALVSSSLAAFEIESVKLASESGHNLSSHPHLPISMHFPREEPGYGVVRLEKQQGKPSLLCRLTVRFNRLLRAVNQINAQVFKRLQVFKKSQVPERLVEDETACDVSRQEIFDWLPKLILKPQTGLPIIGKVRLNHEDLAPWDDESYAEVELFTPVQRDLIEYFTEEQSTENLQNHAAFIVASWYQLRFPAIYNALDKISLR
ncbi:hypothetical protein MJO29_011355 [Puccinia striiformis f. sp. tritici]|uniref:Uncharacterized protein n=1 Tax=Puccinia striiformis f. sp. tritici PST-78 TaxID=1165861 RepID=A0A0L0VPJ0_9BASI|nr:hypothetical protein MJO29_011355 [Puccinia striiformis f. sp. tritici]KNF01194.1 hypothetical protein PSTG_05550 [Puccinia striiformis f. sp. tritici PST-78]